MPNNRKYNSFIEETGLQFYGALQNDEIIGRLRPLSYPESVIQELIPLLEETRSVYRDHQRKCAAQYQATDAFYDAIACQAQALYDGSGEDEASRVTTGRQSYEVSSRRSLISAIMSSRDRSP
jgi:hypothetical protein